MKLSITLRLIQAVLFLLSGCASGPESRVKAAQLSDKSQPWRLHISWTSTTEAGKATTVFIVTAVNTGREAQTLFTPGLVGPAFWPRGENKGEPMKGHVPPRTGDLSRLDYVTLRPGEGFSRSFTYEDDIKQLATTVRAVSADLLLYQAGFEGHSDKVAGSVTACPIELPTTPGH